MREGEKMKICNSQDNYEIYFTSNQFFKNSNSEYEQTELKNYFMPWINSHPNCNKVLIVSDKNIEFYQQSILNHIVETFRQLNLQVDLWILEPGEESKSLKTAEIIWQYMAEHTYSRFDLMVALGGGVVGDLTGFCASSYMRGISLIQIPTTLLSQIDSSIGGKVAINLPQGKNLVGAFYNPELVIIHSGFLSTLSDEVVSDGLGEMIKYAYLGNPELLVTLDYFNNLTGFKKGLEKETDIIENMVRICLRTKKIIVENDFKENSIRKYLNLGHTIGHSIESSRNYEMSHGHCVANGCLWVMKLVGLSQAVRTLTELMYRFEIPVIETLNISEIMLYLKRDKKAEGDGVCFVIPNGATEMQLSYYKSEETGIMDFIMRNHKLKEGLSDSEWLESIEKSVALKWISFDEIEDKLKQLNEVHLDKLLESNLEISIEEGRS